MDKQQTIQLLTLIASSYENFMPKDSDKRKILVDIWHETLEEISYDEAKTALKTHMKESVYVPKIADIYQRVINKKIPDIPDPVAEFNTVLRSIGKFGYNRTEEAMDSFNPITRRVVEMLGGFRKFCMSDCDNEISDRKHFTETYNRLIEREKKVIRDGGNSFLQIEGQTEEQKRLSDVIEALTKKM